MDFRYKAKVDKKWLKGRSLTDHKEDASEFESESEPTQIINQLKRDGKVAQKAVIKIVKKRESVELNYENIYRESENKIIKTPYGKMQVVDEFVIQDDDKFAFVQKAEEMYKELEKDGWFHLEKTEPYWYAFPYNRAKFTLCANDTDKICFIDYRKEGYDMIFENSDSSQSKMKVEEGIFTPKSWSAKGIEKAKKEKSELEKNPHKYSVHIKNLSTEQLFGLIAMNNIKNEVSEYFGFGITKIDGKFYLYKWQPDECDWAHPRMEMNKLTYESRDIHLCLLSREDFTDEMADDLSHWIESKEPWGTCSGRVFPIFASAASESSDAKYEGIIVFGNDKSSINKYKKIYEKLINGKNALPIERSYLSGDISEIPNKFQNGSWLSVSLDPKEIMSLGIGQRDIYDDTLKKNYGEIIINDLNESENLEVNIDYNNIYREGKIKEFGPTYYYNLVRKYNEKLCDAKNDLEEAFFDYIHDAFWYASESIKSAQYKFYLRQLITEPSSFDYYHGEDFEEDYAYDFKQFIKDPIKNENILKKYLNKEDIPAWENLKNLFSDDKSYERFNKKYKKEREDSEAKRAESEAKFKQETKPLDDAIKSVGLEIFYFEYFKNMNEFAFVINTEDEYDAENARDEVAKVLNGAADNAYGASYDDIEGMGDIHLGCVQFYEFSEMNGGDRYEDLDEDYRDKYVIFACPKQKWINYRRMTDY
jgi:hypothetical protein